MMRKKLVMDAPDREGSHLPNVRIGSTTDSGGYPQFRPLSGVERKSISEGWRSVYSHKQTRAALRQRPPVRRSVVRLHSDFETKSTNSVAVSRMSRFRNLSFRIEEFILGTGHFENRNGLWKSLQ